VDQRGGSKLPPVSEQMLVWSMALASELRDWPQVTQKSFFGFTALYRGKTIFGLLPRTRSISKDSALAFRLHTQQGSTPSRVTEDSRIAPFDKHRTRWFTFELSRDTDLRDALAWLALAYEAARSGKRPRPGR